MEISRASNGTPLESLCTGLRSSLCYSASFQGVPFMIFGIGSEGTVWALGTEWITENPTKFQRVTLKVLPLLFSGHKQVRCIADAKNVFHLKWLLKNKFAIRNTVLIKGNIFYHLIKNV